MKQILFAISALALFTACSSDDFVPELTEQSGTSISSVQMSTDRFLADDASLPLRTTINTNGTFLWARGDQVGVWPTLEQGEEPSASQVLFSVSEGAGTANAVFTGSGWGLLHNRTYYAYYPYKVDAASNAVKNIYQDNLVQMFNNTTFHIAANDFMYSSTTTPEQGNTANFQFHHMGSLICLVIKLPAAAASTIFKTISVSTKSGKEVFPVEVSYNPSSDAPAETVLSRSASQTLSLGLNSNGFKPSANSITAWFLCGATDLSGQTLNVVVSNATTTYSGTFEGALQLAGHARSYTVTATAN